MEEDGFGGADGATGWAPSGKGESQIMMFDDYMSYTSGSDDGEAGFAEDWGARVVSCVQQLVRFAWTLSRTGGRTADRFP
jgi:hypothetical protein